jgi:hypothetical protein
MITVPLLFLGKYRTLRSLDRPTPIYEHPA